MFVYIFIGEALGYSCLFFLNKVVVVMSKIALGFFENADTILHFDPLK